MNEAEDLIRALDNKPTRDQIAQKYARMYDAYRTGQLSGARKQFVDAAIVEHWSISALYYIKRQASTVTV